jgi:hypothetical protein
MTFNWPTNNRFYSVTLEANGLLCIFYLAIFPTLWLVVIGFPRTYRAMVTHNMCDYPMRKINNDAHASTTTPKKDICNLMLLCMCDKTGSNSSFFIVSSVHNLFIRTYKLRLQKNPIKAIIMKIYFHGYIQRCKMYCGYQHIVKLLKYKWFIVKVVLYTYTQGWAF